MPTPDGYVDINEAAAEMPGRPHRNSVYRWCTEGVSVRGTRLMLRSHRIGARLHTRPEWIAEFQRALNTQGSPAQRPRKRKRRAERERELARVQEQQAAQECPSHLERVRQASREAGLM